MDLSHSGQRTIQGRARTYDSNELPPRLPDDDWPVLTMQAPSTSLTRENLGPRFILDQSAEAEMREDRRAHRRRRRTTRWCAALLLMGISMFTAGAILIAMSFRNDGQQLWNVGAPLAMAGQGLFLVGLILQLDILWQQGNDAKSTLQRLDRYVASDAAKAQEKSAADFATNRSDAPQTERFLAELKQRLDLINPPASRRSI